MWRQPRPASMNPNGLLSGAGRRRPRNVTSAASESIPPPIGRNFNMGSFAGPTGPSRCHEQAELVRWRVRWHDRKAALAKVWGDPCQCTGAARPQPMLRLASAPAAGAAANRRALEADLIPPIPQRSRAGPGQRLNAGGEGTRGTVRPAAVGLRVQRVTPRDTFECKRQDLC